MEELAFFVCCRAVVDHCVGKDLPSISVESFEYFPGRGLIATLNNTQVEFPQTPKFLFANFCFTASLLFFDVQSHSIYP